MRILVAEDDPTTRELLRHTLENDGHEVVCACDGREALSILARDSIRMIISDWEMPHMNGIELCEAVRDEERIGYVYFILLTRNGSPQDIVAGLSAGADDYVTKPFEHAELMMRIRAGERILGLESRDITIFALAKLAESRDPDTGAHLERVRSYSHVLARHLSQVSKFAETVDGTYVELIYQTSPLHDIGKVALPDYVLLKADRLTEQEIQIMKKHTVCGAETLDAALREYPNAQFLIMARDIAMSHHEWWDGSGYPQGLAGEEIPLCGRIVALADVYDALTSKRVYKDKFSHELARSIIIGEAGRHFDPDIVAAFIANEEEFQTIRRQYCDDEVALTALHRARSTQMRDVA